MLVSVIHDDKHQGNSTVAKFSGAHLYFPEDIPFDVDTCRTLSSFTILVILPHLLNTTVAVPYSTYRSKKNTEGLAFTGSFAFSSSKDFSTKVSGSYYRPIPILDKE